MEDHVRPISHRLYPSILRRGLIASLQSLGDQFEQTLNIEMKMDQEIMRQERLDPRLIPEQIRLSTYRIAEEALTNIFKHSKNSNVVIELEQLPEGCFQLTVQDNGRGFHVENESEGLGILMMQDYAEMAGGYCAVHSGPGEGTSVLATFPLEAPAAEHPEKTIPSE